MTTWGTSASCSEDQYRHLTKKAAVMMVVVVMLMLWAVMALVMVMVMVMAAATATSTAMMVVMTEMRMMMSVMPKPLLMQEASPFLTPSQAGFIARRLS